jgi:predicted SnoaL-like aldol condensation-catalyzing enzyme
MKTKRRLGVLAAVAVAAVISGGISTAAADESGGRTASGGGFGGPGHGGAKACARGQAQLDRNVRTAVAYYTLAFNSGLPRLAVAKYVGVDEQGNKTYTQHNPFAQDGPEAFIAFVELYKGLFPDLNVRIVRTIAQCDLVMTHSHITTGPDDLGNAAMDVFRFDRTGRIVEHWDAVQPVEANSANDNTQF